MVGLRKERLAEFTEWVANHITGDEKGEAQIFLDRLFRAFNQPGCLDVGGKPEFRIRKSKEDGGGTAFADYVWQPVVLIEMKKRGVDLSRHFRQAFDYWVRLVPGRPRYVVLCNFDEFWVYDFETQMDTPVDKLKVEDLPRRYGPLAFLFPTPEKPIFGNDHEAVTREAADRLAVCFNKLITRKIDRVIAQRFILQTLVALFSEDIGLLQQYTLAHLLEECESPTDSYDLLGGLFVEMNTPGVTPGGRYKGVDYFNGGLFAEPVRLELYEDELNQLRRAAKHDWSMVRPEIFGTLFEHSLDHEERHAFGQHFTSAVDIMKIVGPTIVQPWRELIENATSIKRLGELRKRMSEFHVLDPACGSGNFLYIAYREMKRLEALIFERMAELSKRTGAVPRELSFITARNFFGIDINPFAVELAKVTMMIARKLAIDELKIPERALPLDNLNNNFIAGDALIDANGKPVAWPQADVIIGNPPFLGAKLLKPERGVDYVNAVRKAYPDVPGMADYCVYWIRKAHDHLPECTSDDPVAGRAGLVGTQNIRNNKSRVGGLDHVVRSGTIVEAVDNQPWSGEANVHVSIANWVKHPLSNEGLTERERAVVRKQLLIPEQRQLWFKVDPVPGKKKIRKKGSGPSTKEYELAYRDAEQINSALSDQTDVSTARILKINTEPQRVFRGQEPGNRGFVLSEQQRSDIVTKDLVSKTVIFPHLVGNDLLTGSGTPARFVIDFGTADQLDASSFAGAFEHVKSTVLWTMQEIERKEAAGQAHYVGPRKLTSRIERWWLFRRACTDTIHAINELRRYIVCSRHMKRSVFCFMHPSVRPDSAIQVFSFEDDYSYSVLQSNLHWQWFIAKCSKLKSDFRYTPESVFDTFPWPQSPSVKQIDAVAEAGREVRQERDDALTKIKGGLRAVYRTLELPGKNPLKDAHAELDKAVLTAYGFSAKKDLLAQLLELNFDVAGRIEAGQPVTAPGVPSSYGDPTNLITDDCIRP